MNVTYPNYMDLETWASRIIYDLAPQFSFGKIQDYKDWKDWGCQFSTANIFGAIPDPYMFDDWNQWAMSLCRVIDS